MKTIESLFERFLWNSRFVTILAVLASLVAAITVFLVGTADAVHLVAEASNYLSAHGHERHELRAAIITTVVEIIDGYLLATVLLIFSFGIYELFISKLDPATSAKSEHSVFVVKDLEDLKSRLGKVVLMILIVKYFELALDMKITEPLEALYFAAGIALIAAALRITRSAPKGAPEKH